MESGEYALRRERWVWRGTKVIAILTILLSLINSIYVNNGLAYFSESNNWAFSDNCNLKFSPAVNFSEVPYKGTPTELVGYWNMDEGANALLLDSSGYNNSAALSGGASANGKYGSAVSFAGNGSFSVKDSPSLHVRDMTISLWYSGSLPIQGSASYRNLLAKGDYWDNNMWALYSSSSNFKTLTFATRTNGSTIRTLAYTYNDTGFVNIVVTKAAGLTKMYINGKMVASGVLDDDTSLVNQSLQIGGAARPIACVLDDVRIYSRALSDKEVVSLCSQPNPESFSSYYCFEDTATGNIMCIYLYKSSSDSSVVDVTCTDFFAGNKLVFSSNGPAKMNLWTNLGQPSFIANGAWNSENSTATLTVGSSSPVELNWNVYNIITYTDAHSSVSPLNVSVAYGGSQTFTFSATQGYRLNVTVDGVSHGSISNYSFVNVTASHTLNVTSIQLFAIEASADANSSIDPSGFVLVGYGETQQFNITAKSGYRISHVYVDGADQDNLSSYNFTNVRGNHTISVISELASSNQSQPTNSVLPTGSQTPQVSGSPSASNVSQTSQPTPTSPIEGGGFPTQAVLIVVAAIVVFVVLSGLAFKKGWVSIETVNPVEVFSGEVPEENETMSKSHSGTSESRQLRVLIDTMQEVLKERIASNSLPFFLYVEGLYVKDGKILLLKRAAEPLKGYWHVVSGQFQEGKPLKDALKMEYKQQTNLDVEIGEIIGGRIEETSDETRIVVSFEVTSAVDLMKLSGEDVEWRWFSQLPLNIVYDYSKFLRKNV